MTKLACSLAIILMATTACTEKKSEGALTASTSLNVHFPSVDLNLDPHKMEDMFSMVINGQIHRGLLRYSPSGDVLPDLASDWTESADHRTYTIHLREAKFSDGSRIDALNVQMSFARLFFLGAAIGADIDYIEGAKEFRATNDLAKLGIKVRSENVVEFRLKSPTSLFLKHLAVADCAILPIRDFRTTIKFDAQTPFSGPYKVIKIESNGAVTIGKWREDQLQSKNPPTTIRFFPTAESPFSLAESGKTDCLDHDILEPAQRSTLTKRNWSETPTELIGETYVIMNPKKVAAEVRAAMAAAISPIDASRVLGPKYVPAFGIIPRGVQGEMRESDYPGVKSARVRPSSIRLQFDPNNPVHVRLESFLTGKWQAIGISVHPIPLPKKDLLKRVFGSECDVCIGQKGLDYPDGYSVLTYFKSSYPSNYFHVHNAKIDQMIDEAGRILDKDKRETEYRNVQRQILSEHTLIPLAFGAEASGLWSPKVKAVPPHIIGFHMMPFEAVEMAP